MNNSPALLRREGLALLRQAMNNPTADFRDGQWEAIEAILKNQRVLVVQRTGWGKSMVYFLATRLLRNQGRGLTLLISPLRALMRNQIVAAERIGIRADTINTDNKDQWAEVETRLLNDETDILLISPERLANERFQTLLGTIAERIGLFVVDEAHCISDWGHDFRPDYLRIVRILQALPPNLPALATTATANNRVVEDIVSQLGPNLELQRGSLTRDSLQLQNISLPDQSARMAWLAEYVPHLPGSGIIYTLTVKDADRLAAWLQNRGIDAHPYHASCTEEDRHQREDDLLANKVKALVATTSLGMGFDKPDLGFVIHFQRPSSAVHYYQQVGRAGRALDNAYGILLSGKEDDQITEYFIKSAFPPEGHVAEVLEALNNADNGLTVPKLESQLNLSRGQIEKVLKMLAVKSPAPVLKEDKSWYSTATPYVPNTELVERLLVVRRHEQERMRNYVENRECLMGFLRRELDDPEADSCGRCAVCQRGLLSEAFSGKLATEAVKFLQKRSLIIEPRKRWPAREALTAYGWGSGNIALGLQAEEGRALSQWGDPGWGELVRQGKQIDNHFDDALVSAAAQLVETWNPQPAPTWVTCVPSLKRPILVPDFARRLAEALDLPFYPCVSKVLDTRPQKEMQNSYQQTANLNGAFAVEITPEMHGAVLLVDDMVDSRWTLAVIAALLRQKGSGSVFPLALSVTTPSE
jgi:ATP-dependent DNA helicase RecQ